MVVDGKKDRRSWFERGESGVRRGGEEWNGIIELEFGVEWSGVERCWLQA